MNVEITPLIHFIKYLSRTKDAITNETKEEESIVEKETDVLDEVSEETEEIKKEEEASQAQEDEEEEEGQECEEHETDEDETDDETEEENSIPHKHTNNILISNTRIDIPFPITCTFTILMALYGIQLGLFFCRLIGCNYLEYSHDEL